MLEVLVRLEQRLAGEELDQDAADRPDVARVAPAHACAVSEAEGARDGPRMISGAR